ncbi:MAG: GTPase RsgA [Kiritimatiellae bacterium]|nr:GTPase RsgA [Kiritimatiellia bacterium]MBR4523554.1 GTPase RsgA [Kiritimatiellia bacterium]
MTRLRQFGFSPGGDDTSGIARIVSAHGDYYHLVCDEAAGEVLARKKKSAFLRPGAVKPMTGDFVRFTYNRQGESMITEVLPRFSKFERKDPAARRQAQTLAVNFDVLLIMMAVNEDFSLPRLERYLALAEEVGRAEVAVVLTKCDLGEREVDAPVKVIKLSCRTGQGLEEIRALVRPGRTAALVGSSGVGKSTLVNTLAGAEWQAVQEVQEWSGKGRHTTTSRELIMLPDGAMVVDTPGIREIGRVGEEEAELAKGAASHRYRLK